MPYVIRYVSSGDIINDFQSKASGQDLIDNAVQRGLGVAEDFETELLSFSEWRAVADQYRIDNPASPKPEPMIKMEVELTKGGGQPLDPSTVTLSIYKDGVPMSAALVMQKDQDGLYSREFQLKIIG
jgi:hypothetical protein